MAKIETLRSLYLDTGMSDPVVPSTLKRRASTTAYDAGANGRRSYGWNSTRLGQNTNLIVNQAPILARARDMVRNNPWATAAIDRFESNVIGTGIKPHWQHRNPDIRDKIQAAWDKWQRKADYLGQNDFYTMQGIAAREVFEAGEVFMRYRLRPSSIRKKDKLQTGFQIQLLEAEQLPVFRNIIPSQSSSSNSVKAGIEFDPDMRRVGYWFYAEHPGEAMLYPNDAMRFIFIPADQIRHIYKPLRASQLRGEPKMVSVLALLYELDQYEDAAIVKKKIQAMFAAFIQKPAPEVDLMPPPPINPNSPNASEADNPNFTPVPDLGTSVAKIETGTMQELLPGENVVFPNLPTENDFEAFMRVTLHKFAAGVGLTYEQLTGDLTGVNYSSIRSGMLEFRRACEQYQANVMVHQFCTPVAERWIEEAVLSGALDLPGYLDDPDQYTDIVWVAQGWSWVDPLKESQAALNDVRSGFESRTRIVRSRGGDPDVVDAQQAEERKRAEELGLMYDSDPNKILQRGAKNPDIITDANPDRETDEVAGGDETDNDRPEPKVPAVLPARQLPSGPGGVPSKGPGGPGKPPQNTPPPSAPKAPVQ